MYAQYHNLALYAECYLWSVSQLSPLLSVLMLNIIMLSVIMLIVIMVSVIMLIVILVNVIYAVI